MDDCITIDLAQLARSVKLPLASVQATMALLDEGKTIPFITRYRRDHTDGLDEEQIEAIRQAAAELRQLEQRKATILRSLETQQKLTDELRTQVQQAKTLRYLEDLYLPYKPKRQSLASKAREQGLASLAEEIFSAADSCHDLSARAAQAIAVEKGVSTADEALTGAGHILAEQFSEQAALRQRLRKLFRKTGQLTTKQIHAEHKKNALFKDYADYREPLTKIPPHRVLAINRGEREKVLRVALECDRAALERLAIEQLVPPEHPHAEFLRNAVRDALERLLLPSLEREGRRELTEKAEKHAVEVFARNLRALLLQPPVAGQRVLAIDPGYKNGCKVAMLDEHGELLELGLVHIVGSEEQQTQARQKLLAMVEQHRPTLFAIGNGSACRPTEQLVAELLANELADSALRYVIVNEAGASVYSTSAMGREEFPHCEAIDRSAISIGRRLQDPLSELVKIDPASIGVGLYQHDAKPAHLRETLEATVQSCVSFVGVDVNTASAALLKNVAGLNQLVARRILEYRTEQGPFRSRQALREVKGLGETTFEQAAGFLKVSSGENPLDHTWVHPENYPAAQRLLAELGIELAELGSDDWNTKFAAALEPLDRQQLATTLELGEHALEQLIEALARPGRDLRSDLPPPAFRRDVVKLDDLSVGMQLRGTVLNVVDFGAFVDVGLSDSGLVHVSQMQNDYVRDPHAVVSVGDQVDCWVTSIDTDRRRVALTMIEPGTEKPPAERKPSRGRGKRPRHSNAGDSKTDPSHQGANSTAGPGGPSKSAKRNGSHTPPSANDQRQGNKRSSPRKSRPSRKGERNRPSRSPQTGRTYEKRAALEVQPLTAEMEQGTEAMRSFSDLLQFHRKKSEQPSPPQGDSPQPTASDNNPS